MLGARLEAWGGWALPLDAALFENSIDRQTLDALMAVMHDAFLGFRRYLKPRARALGLPVLAWYDLDAPLDESKRAWSFAVFPLFFAPLTRSVII
jgi:oligoendopeptidase F